MSRRFIAAAVVFVIIACVFLYFSEFRYTNSQTTPTAAPPTRTVIVPTQPASATPTALPTATPTAGLPGGGTVTPATAMPPAATATAPKATALTATAPPMPTATKDYRWRHCSGVVMDYPRAAWRPCSGQMYEP